MGADRIEAWGAAVAAAGGDPGAVLAGIAEELGVAWDGPGDGPGLGPGDGDGRGRPPVPDGVPGWLALDAAREALLDAGTRRRLGAHHTPPALARRLVHVALDGLAPHPASIVACDPACGGGAFLVAAADALVAGGADPAAVVAEQLLGFDLDPLAVATTRAALRCWAADRGAGDAEPRRLVVGDGLAVEWTADVVVGNPPFLSPLGTAIGGGRVAVARRRRLGAPYADVAALFLLHALERMRVGGRAVLIQPESLLTARDARPVREAVSPHVRGLWVADEPVFGAPVRVCAPVLERRPDDDVGATRRVRRWRGAAVRSTGTASFDPAAGTWSHLRTTTAPRPRRRAMVAGPTIADIATATAGFRDQFYGLAAVVAERGADDAVPLVTSGLLDPGRCAWGERAARIAGRRYAAPVVRLDDIGGLDPRLRAWVEARLVPKVLVATQTRVVEAAPDPDGRFVPLTPVLAVVPNDPGDVWRLAAALTDPAVTAWARREFAGAALSSDAVKLSAKQVLTAPLPPDERAWSEAIDRIRRGDVVGCGEVLAGADRRLYDWWRDRLPARRPAPDGDANLR